MLKYALVHVIPRMCFRSVVRIDQRAFSSTGLLNITVPTSVTFLGTVVLTSRIMSLN
jgi:hypothetical protein